MTVHTLFVWVLSARAVHLWHHLFPRQYPGVVLPTLSKTFNEPFPNGFPGQRNRRNNLAAVVCGDTCTVDRQVVSIKSKCTVHYRTSAVCLLHQFGENTTNTKTGFHDSKTIFTYKPKRLRLCTLCSRFDELHFPYYPLTKHRRLFTRAHILLRPTVPDVGKLHLAVTVKHKTDNCFYQLLDPMKSEEKLTYLFNVDINILLAHTQNGRRDFSRQKKKRRRRKKKNITWLSFSNHFQQTLHLSRWSL